MKNEYDRIWHIALDLLAKRNHTVFELERKLLKRGFDKVLVENIVSKCGRLHFVDDRNSGRCYLNELIRKGYGPHRIRYEMGRKGIDGQLINELFGEERVEEMERDLCKKVLARKIKTVTAKKDLKKRKNHLFRFLIGRGFSRSVTMELISEFYPESH